MNDHLNENNLPEDGLAPDELFLMKEALDAAWPPPKNSIRDGVMAQIRRERTAEKRRRLRSRMVKYGSLAACLVLITVAGIRALPSLMGNSADMAAEAYIAADHAQPAEAMPETKTAERENGEVTKTMNFSAQTVAASEDDGTAEEITEDAVMEEAPSDAPAETAPETLAETESELPPSGFMLMFAAPPASEEAAAEECVVECEAEKTFTYSTDLAETAQTVCAHSGVFADSYHTIPEVIIACTGEDVYLAWLDGTEGCERNIAEYLDYMEENTTLVLPEIQLIYDASDLWYRYDWNFELFASEDSAAIEKYYQNGGDFAGMVKRETEYRFKLALLDETGAEKSVDVCAWSIADLVEEQKMTLSALTAVYESSADEIEADYPGYTAQQYDLAALHDYAYSQANDEPTLPDALAPGRHEDEMFRVSTEILK